VRKLNRDNQIIMIQKGYKGDVHNFSVGDEVFEEIRDILLGEIKDGK